MTVRAQGPPASRDGEAEATELDPLAGEHGFDARADVVVVRRRQAQPGHRPVEPPQVPGESERHAVVDLRRLEATVPDGHAMVDGTDGGRRGATRRAVHPHPET